MSLAYTYEGMGQRWYKYYRHCRDIRKQIHTSQYSWLQSMHCQNSIFLLKRQLGIFWKPLAASTASSVVSGFWINFPLHFVHLDISRSSEISNWNVWITCAKHLNFSHLTQCSIINISTRQARTTYMVEWEDSKPLCLYLPFIKMHFCSVSAIMLAP